MLVVAGSRGLGAVVCVKFAKEGANVAITYMANKARAEQVAKECESHGVKTLLMQADGGSSADCTRVVEETSKQFGGLDVIIGNAVRASHLYQRCKYHGTSIGCYTFL